MIDPNTGQFNEGFIRLVIFSNFVFQEFYIRGNFTICIKYLSHLTVNFRSFVE